MWSFRGSTGKVLLYASGGVLSRSVFFSKFSLGYLPSFVAECFKSRSFSLISIVANSGTWFRSRELWGTPPKIFATKNVGENFLVGMLTKICLKTAEKFTGMSDRKSDSYYVLWEQICRDCLWRAPMRGRRKCGNFGLRLDGCRQLIWWLDWLEIAWPERQNTLVYVNFENTEIGWIWIFNWSRDGGDRQWVPV